MHSIARILIRLAAAAQFEYWWKETGDLSPNLLEDFRILSDRIGNVQDIVRCKVGTKRREIRDVSCFWGNLGGLAQRKCSLQQLRDKVEDSIPMRLRHSENEVSVGGNFRSKLSRNEIRCIATQTREDQRGVTVNRMCDYCAGSSARRLEVGNAELRPIRQCKALRRRGSTNVSSTDKQHVQFGSPLPQLRRADKYER